MELTLNLGWALVAVWMLFVCVRMAPRTAVDRRAQFIALAIVILILLPVISVTDDLAIAVQNPAEIDYSVYSVRKNHDFCSPRSIVPAASALPAPAFAGLSITDVHMAAPGILPAPFVAHPALGPIQNRPFPAA
jgi:hypothetical protein